MLCKSIDSWAIWSRKPLFSLNSPSSKEVSVYFNNWTHLHRPLLLDYSPSLLAWWYSFRRVFDNAAAAGCSRISLGISRDTRLDGISRFEQSVLITGSGCENRWRKSFQVFPHCFPGFLIFIIGVLFGIFKSGILVFQVLAYSLGFGMRHLRFRIFLYVFNSSFRKRKSVPFFLFKEF